MVMVTMVVVVIVAMVVVMESGVVDESMFRRDLSSKCIEACLMDVSWSSSPSVHSSETPGLLYVGASVVRQPFCSRSILGRDVEALVHGERVPTLGGSSTSDECKTNSLARRQTKTQRVTKTLGSAGREREGARADITVLCQPRSVTVAPPRGFATRRRARGSPVSAAL